MILWGVGSCKNFHLFERPARRFSACWVLTECLHVGEGATLRPSLKLGHPSGAGPPELLSPAASLSRPGSEAGLDVGGDARWQPNSSAVPTPQMGCPVVELTHFS